MKTHLYLACLLLLGLAQPSDAFGGGETSALEPDAVTANAYIIMPLDGAVISGPVKVVFGLRNMTVAPAGTDMENSGHHHLLVDHAIPPMEEAMPNEEGLLHFGGGQTETTLDLPPGKHTLQLIMGDQYHIPHNPPVVSQRITITVE
jgi:hypothetical protein